MVSVKAKTIIKKKVWAQILPPSWIGGDALGETHITELDEAVGKTLSVSMTFLTGDPQKQHINLKFLITGKKDNNLTTELIGFIFSLTSAKRFVRKGREKIECSFIANTKDDKKVRLKFVLLSRGVAKGKVKSALHTQGKEFLTKNCLEMTFQELMDSILQHKIQKEMAQALKKVYPIALSEIRWAELERSEKANKKFKQEKTQEATLKTEVKEEEIKNEIEEKTDLKIEQTEKAET